MDRNILEATRREFERRGTAAHRQFAVLLEVERINRLVQAAAQPALAEAGLTFAGWQALTALSFHPKKQLPTAKLAVRVGAHPTTITRTVDRLERAAYVKRASAPGDRRVTTITLLPAGEDAQAAVLAALDSRKFGFGGASEQFLDDLTVLLRDLRQSMEDHLRDLGTT